MATQSTGAPADTSGKRNMIPHGDKDGKCGTSNRALAINHKNNPNSMLNNMI